MHAEVSVISLLLVVRALAAGLSQARRDKVSGHSVSDLCGNLRPRVFLSRMRLFYTPREQRFTSVTPRPPC